MSQTHLKPLKHCLVLRGCSSFQFVHNDDQEASTAVPVAQEPRNWRGQLGPLLRILNINKYAGHVAPHAGFSYESTCSPIHMAVCRVQHPAAIEFVTSFFSKSSKERGEISYGS